MIPRPLIFSSSFRHYHFQNQENKKGKEREDFEHQQLKSLQERPNGSYTDDGLPMINTLL
jgi:hypothetical protein